jgi:hypothetical protein
MEHEQELASGGPKMQWHDAEIDQIKTREDLAAYLASLARRIQAGEAPTTHHSVEDYLEAAGAWTGSMDGYFANVVKAPVPTQPDWKMIAAILTAATVYE